MSDDDKNPFSKISPFIKKDSKFYKSSFKDDFTNGLSQVFLPKNGTWTFSTTELKEVKPVIISNFLEFHENEEKKVYSQLKDKEGKTQAIIIFHQGFIERYLHYSMGGNLKSELHTKNKNIELSTFNLKVMKGLSNSLSKVLEYSFSKSISINLSLENDVLVHNNLIQIDAPTHSFYHIEIWLKEDNSTFDLLLRSEHFN